MNAKTDNVNSSKSVDGVSTTQVKDDPKTGTTTTSAPTNTRESSAPDAAPKKDAAQNTVPPVPNATNTPDGVISQMTEGEKEQNAAFEKALAEKDNVLTPSEQRKIDAMHDSEPTDPPREEKDALESLHHRLKADHSLTGRIKAFVEAEGSALKVITNLVRDIPSDTPDDYILGGAAGHKLRLGHLRALIMGIHG